MNTLIRTAFAGIAVTVGLLLASASPAAAFTAGDNFEPPSNNWTFIPVGGSTVDYTNVGPRSGVRALKLIGKAPGYALARRVMVLGDERKCGVSIWVDPHQNNVATPVNLEIVNPSTNHYIHLKTVTLPSAAGYTPISTSFVSPVANVDIRVAVGTSVPGASVSATVDDLFIECKKIA
jgi:hypothetical protein